MTDLELDVAESFERIYPVPVANEDWNGVLDRAGEQEPRIARTTWGLSALRKRPGRVTLAFAILAGAVGAALFLSAPWTSSPGFLERAQAALTPPAGSILHYEWEYETPSAAGCASPRLNEIWIDQTPPYAYRLLLTDCGGEREEVAGALDTKGILMFEPPNTLTVPDLIFDRPPDPVAALRASIREGSAHHEGTTQLGGRTVERIRIECSPDSPCARRPAYVYVDPDTFLPVQEVFPGAFGSVTGGQFDLVTRYQTHEYLPRTAANLALTDIRAQHPNAIGP
jgi:hypothetical protein